jgi:signal transduction histidine kinase/CheY-like chemotaxis protein
MVLGTSLGYALRERLPRVASVLFIGGVFIAVFCGMLAFESLDWAFLFVLPVIFSSVLLSPLAFLGTAVVAVLLTTAIGPMRIGMSPAPAVTAFPAAVILLATLSAWLSARSLHTALAWAWGGYERARRNEKMQRRQAGELRRTLKALDEATHRLERTNYMLALARDQAYEARRLKQHFAQTISHELRTPLNLIVGFTELMTESPEYYDGHLSSGYLRDLNIVHRNACHLQTLVNDVLDLARIEAAQMSILPEETDPAILVREVIDTVRSLVEAHGLALHVEVEPELPTLWVDRVRIRQVFFNLLNNAVRFTERGSITASVSRQDGNIVFAVADTGAGIAPKDLASIFEEFQQADGSTRRRHGGAGLGLAISRRFVELHGGRIWVESQVGQGSTFYFVLPAGEANLAEMRGDRLAQAAATGPVSPKGSEEPVLLAVTRSLSAATLLTRYVRDCRTIVVPDLEEAQSRVQRLMPQAVIIDRTCERVDDRGLEALAGAWGVSHIPFIACPLPGEESLRQHLAVDGYLVKPVLRRSLWDVLRRFGEDVDRVLVVDDDQDFALLASRILKDSPVRRYQVNCAYGGQEGLEMMRQNRPDLVLLDLGLPDMHGSEVIGCIRSNPAWEHIPIVIVSARDELDTHGVLTGAMTITKADGLVPGEVVRWVQSAMDATTMSFPRPRSPIEVPVP